MRVSNSIDRAVPHISKRLDSDRQIATWRPPCWTWEIQRRPNELGIKVYGTDFKTGSAAKPAGEKALVPFLDGLAIVVQAAERKTRRQL
jgi:hypothetical protein